MKPMTSSSVEPADLLDLKLLPAWVKEPVEAKRYGDAEGDYDSEHPARHRRGTSTRMGRHSTFISDKSSAGARRPVRKGNKPQPGRGRFKPGRDSRRRGRVEGRPRGDEHRPVALTPLQITVRFLPYSPAFENVVAQIKS